MLTSAATEFRQSLNDGDARRLRAMWREFFPHLPQPSSDSDAAIVMHRARTGAQSVRLEKRLYSHAWLTERAYPSDLPEDLRPPGERVESVIVPAVGVSVSTTSAFPDRREEAKHVEAVMARAAGEMVIAGVTDRETIVAHMWAMRDAYRAGRLRREI